MYPEETIGVPSGEGNTFAILKSLYCRLRAYYLLLLSLCSVMMVLLFLYYVVVSPVYTAQALIGPPLPSPTSAMYSSMAQSVGGGLANKLMGGGGNNFFSMYRQLLVSPRITVELVEKDQFLKKIFYKQWDAVGKSWSKPSSLHGITSFVKQLMHRPTSDHPGTIELQKYLDKNFTIMRAESPGRSAISSLTSDDNSYITVTLNGESPQQAENLLGTILARADAIIRQEQLRDVNARIAYIENELPRIAQAEQKAVMIQVLAQQEQIRIMTVVDKRFAYVLISTPYASVIPSLPMPVGSAVVRLMLLGVLLWLGLVAAEPRVIFLQTWLRPFLRRRG